MNKKTLKEIATDVKVVLASTIIGNGSKVENIGKKSSKDYSFWFRKYFY